jgi:2-hydroxychromene-2-carboxylate isomerase
MAEQFKEQGGAATMDPSPLVRWLTSRLMSTLCKPGRLENQRNKIERKRAKSGDRHVVEYFHQVDDGYSHLAAQVLPALEKRYDIDIVCHLVNGPSGANLPEPDLLLKLSRYDSHAVAQEYGLQFPDHVRELPEDLANLACSILAAQDSKSFVELSLKVGDALWHGRADELQALATANGSADPSATKNKLADGDKRLSDLSHYSGAMFYYGGEWYWGVDRLYHLEKRLASLGVDREPGGPLIVDRPPLETGPLTDNGSLTLEVYPSLRSPYTSISFDRTLKLAEDTGVNLKVRPVLPMVMRGVSATRQKGMYIFSDTAREAREAGVPYGNFYDPIGEPVRKAYSIYPWACEQGKGNELLSAFLSCAFAQGISTNSERGLRTVVEQAGLSWSDAKSHIGGKRWEEILEENRMAMYNAGLWGVPSYRLLNQAGDEVLALWGQDRLWLVSREIQRQLAARKEN